jgi:4-hydroxymandelate oxidase
MTASNFKNLSDYAIRAKKILDPEVWHYLAEGDIEESQQALSNTLLMPRPLLNLEGGHTKKILFGQSLEHPIVLAPIAYQKLFHVDGEIASAVAAAVQGGQSVISSLASQSIESIVDAVAQVNGNVPWFQLYWQGDRIRTLSLMQKAIKSGVKVFIFTVDAPIKLASLILPKGISAVNLEKPISITWTKSIIFDGYMKQAPTWDDVLWLRQQTSLFFVLKGILHAEDAEKALSIGCDGLVVSNHGGRVLKGSPPSLRALKKIVHQVKGRKPVLFDSGIRNGRDAFVALAYGATAVMLGRPYIWALSVNGAMGVAQAIRFVRDELEMTMALTGCASLNQINEGVLF